MYDDLKNFIAELIDGDKLVSVHFFYAEFNWRRLAGGFRLHGLFEGFRVRHQVLLEEMSVGLVFYWCSFFRHCQVLFSGLEFSLDECEEYWLACFFHNVHLQRNTENILQRASLHFGLINPENGDLMPEKFYTLTILEIRICWIKKKSKYKLIATLNHFFFSFQNLLAQKTNNLSHAVVQSSKHDWQFSNSWQKKK
jgi:hypothetical protein